MSRKRIILALVVVAGLLTLARFEYIYIIWDVAGAQLVCNADQAVIFVHEGSRGYQHSYLSFPLDAVKQMFYSVSPPDRQRFEYVLFVVTPTKVQRFEIADSSLTDIDPVGDNLYAGSETGIQKWTGSRFIRATAEEKQAYLNAMHSDSHGPDYDNYHGWSARSSILGGGLHQYVIALNGNTLTLEVNGHFNSDLSIEVIRRGQAPEKIWHLNESPRFVSRVEYEQVFGKR